MHLCTWQGDAGGALGGPEIPERGVRVGCGFFLAPACDGACVGTFAMSVMMPLSSLSEEFFSVLRIKDAPSASSLEPQGIEGQRFAVPNSTVGLQVGGCTPKALNPKPETQMQHDDAQSSRGFRVAFRHYPEIRVLSSRSFRSPHVSC